MSAQDPNLRVDDEPEEERPIGAGEQEESESSGLALEPYADDLLIGPRRRGRLPWLLIAAVVVLIVVALVLMFVVLRARGV